MTITRKRLIEGSIPLEAINAASARETAIREPTGAQVFPARTRLRRDGRGDRL